MYLIRYGNEVVAQAGYKGYLELMMRRTDIVSNVYGNIVYKGDEFNASYENIVRFRHVPKFESTELWLTYCVVNFKDGLIQIEVSNKEAIDKSKSLSKGVYYYDKKTGLQKPVASSPWNAHYDSMAKVVPIRKLVNNLAISITIEDEFIKPEEIKRVPLKVISKPDEGDDEEEGAKDAVLAYGNHTHYDFYKD
jgi:phage RecT family recombinase